MLSRRFGLTWLIDLDGDLLGHVTPEGPDTMLQEAMGGFLETAGPDIGEDEAAATVARLRARYPSQGLMYRQTNEASLQPEDSKSSDPRPKPPDTFGWAFKPR